VEFGVHLPQIGWDDEPLTLDRILAVASAAERLGFGTISANDHLVYSRPWFDGPSALSAVVAVAPTARLMTSVALPVVRGPFALAKTLGTIDVLSGGRLDAGLGPGSSAADYTLAGIPFSERWARFDEAVAAMRALWTRGGQPFVGRFYDTTDVRLSPLPAQPSGPSIWIGSWGSAAGLWRVARLADGWLASGYNTTPDSFSRSMASLQAMLEKEGRDPTDFPSTMATTWSFVTEDDVEAQAMLERLAQMVRRPIEDLADRLPIGSPAMCRDLFGDYREAGLQRVLVWPMANEVEQLERMADVVMPLI